MLTFTRTFTTNLSVAYASNDKNAAEQSMRQITVAGIRRLELIPAVRNNFAIYNFATAATSQSAYATYYRYIIEIT